MKLKHVKTSQKFRIYGKVYRKFTTDLGNQQQLCHDLVERKLEPLSHDLEVQVIPEPEFRNA